MMTNTRSVNSFILSLTFLFIFACSERFGPDEDQTAEQGESAAYQGGLAKGQLDVVNEVRLKYFAKALANVLTVPGVGTHLRNEIGKKFDGDYDVLWETVQGSDFPGSGRLSGLVAGQLQALNSIVSMEEIEEVPLLQIALPVGFSDWDGETPILVAYIPLTINDVDLTEIYAYDSAGEEHILDGQVPPEFPVMVIGINERTNPQGEVLFSKGTSSTPIYATDALPPEEPPPPPPPNDYIKIKDYKLDQSYSYYEAGPYGDAEITWHITSGTSIWSTIYYTNILDFLELYWMPGSNDVADISWNIIDQEHTYWEWHFLYGEWHTDRSWQTQNHRIDHSQNAWVEGAPFFTVSNLLSAGINSVYLHSFEKDPGNYDYMGAALINLTSAGIRNGYNSGSLWFKVDYEIVP